MKEHLEWTLYLFLVFPAELVRPKALSGLYLALSEGFLLSLYREVTISVHEEYATFVQPILEGMALQEIKVPFNVILRSISSK